MNEALRTLEALLSNAAATPPRFAPNSRYNALPMLTFTLPDGRTVAYVTRRFIPGPEAFVTVREHLVTQSDRLDLIAATYLADPEQWWKIADWNVALRPEEITETPGARLSISMPATNSGGT